MSFKQPQDIFVDTIYQILKYNNRHLYCLTFTFIIYNFRPKSQNSPNPFPSNPLYNPPNTICCQHTIPPLPSLPSHYPIPLTQSTVNTQFPHSLPFPPSIQSSNTICCQHTISPLPSLPSLYPIPLTQSAVNTQFAHSLPFPPSIQSP